MKRYFISICSFLYNLFFSNLFWNWNFSMKKISGSFLKLTRNKISGKNCVLEIGSMSKLYNCRLVVLGLGNKVKIGKQCRLYNTTIWVEDNYSEIIIGDNCSMQGGMLAALEGKKIIIGDHSMLSHSIEMRTGDSHGIFCSGQRINHAKDIIIGEHVWLGANVTVLKGVSIPKGVIIGHSSVVTKSLNNANSIYAGVPAKLIKENIEWDKKLSR